MCCEKHDRVSLTSVTAKETLVTDGKEISLTCVQMATLALHPNEVLTARGDRPKPENRVENAVVRFILGLSSATTTQFRTQVRFTLLAWNKTKTDRNVRWRRIKET